MAESSANGSLDAKQLTVMSKSSDYADRLFVPQNSEITMWNFTWISDDLYYLSAVENGSTKYLKIDANGVSLVDSLSDASNIQVIPGTGTHAHQISLKANGKTLTYSGDINQGFSVGGSVGNEWLNLVELSEYTDDYQMTYSAQKVSVSDSSVTNGSQIIVYTRVWDDVNKKYEFYAVSHDGTLVQCYENGDSIQWIGNITNKLLWDFVEYYEEGTDTPNYYYELYNEYSGKYIAPQITDSQILSDDTIDINLNGRKNGMYYTSILSWDDDNYSYAGLKIENGQVVTCSKEETDDFYFAIIQESSVDDNPTQVPTIDHTQHGITMKLVDYSGATYKQPGSGSTTTQRQHDVMGNSIYTDNTALIPKQGLLSNQLDGDYPTATITDKSLYELFYDAVEVNHLFYESTYYGSGYFEYDSSQTFASLNGTNFKVYKELGTMDASLKKSLMHGQFMPYNDLTAGSFAVTNTENLYDALQNPLPETDPRKHERLYKVNNPNSYFGMEIEASFTQTPSGHDAWGHDIIYEFTGDDDFWLYVDGELVIDLGGIHSALSGSVNFSTGEVVVNNVPTTL